MYVISQKDYIKCSIYPKRKETLEALSDNMRVYYAETNDLILKYEDFKANISNSEQARADKFHFEKDRHTYISSHALLRLVLSKIIGADPLAIQYKAGINNKPGLVGDKAFFNLSHTREAFSFVVSSSFNVGIDLETINHNFDIKPIAESYFSRRECEYIFKTSSGETDRFFLLWTRKEALLKALGTGLVDNLREIEVSEKENLIKQGIFDKTETDHPLHDLFIYSKHIGANYLSIAVPYRSTFDFVKIDSTNIDYYL